MGYRYSRGKTKTYNRKKKSDHRKINSLVMKVAALKPETKEVYVTRVYAASTISATAAAINVMGLGAANGQRIGNKIRLKSLSLNMVANIAAGQILVGTDTTIPWTLEGAIGELRVIIFCNNQNNKLNTTTLAEILQYAGSMRAAISSVYNLDYVGYRKKYKILYDKYVNISNVGGGTHFAHIHTMIPLKYVVNYAGNNGDSTDIIDKDIRMLVISTGVDLEYQWATRVRYTDV